MSSPMFNFNYEVKVRINNEESYVYVNYKKGFFSSKVEVVHASAKPIE